VQCIYTNMFPEYKTKKILLFKYKVRDGWTDLGEIEPMDYGSGSKDYYKRHSFCGTRINVGKEETGELFHYCPRCMVKVK